MSQKQIIIEDKPVLSLLEKKQSNAINDIYDVLNGKYPDFSKEHLDCLLSIHDRGSEHVTKAVARLGLVLINNLKNIKQWNWSVLDGLEAQIDFADTALCQALAVVRYVQLTHQAMMELGLKTVVLPAGNERDRLVGYLNENADIIARKYPVPAVHKMFLANVASLHDRNKAAKLYKTARLEDPIYAQAAEAERGSSTYYSADVLDNVVVESQNAFQENLQKALAKRHIVFSQPTVNFLWSVDPVFLRIHSAVWLNMAPFLLDRGYGMIVLVAGERHEAEKAIQDAQELTLKMAQFRGLEDAQAYAQNIVFMHIDVPEYVQNVRTYYACARYLYAASVLEVTKKPLFVLDIDMTIKNPIDDFIAKAAQYDWATPVTMNMAALYPWRRYIANTCYFAKTEASSTVLKSVARYIRLGLEEPISWTLDQNALDYGFDCGMEVNGAFYNFNLTQRPLSQDSVRVFFERDMKNPITAKASDSIHKAPQGNQYIFNMRNEMGIEDEQCRLCVYDIKDEKFCLLKIISSTEDYPVTKDDLPAHNPLKYKVQTMQNGRWTDKIHYRKMLPFV